jgi:phosphate-selective porin OprO/OprP
LLALWAPDARAEEPAAAEPAPPEPPLEEPLASEWRVYWDDGVYYRFVQSFPVAAEDRLIANLEDRLGLAGKINVRLELDGAVYGGDVDELDLQDDAEVRRFYLGTSGELFLLTHAWYSVTFEFLDSGAELGDTYLEWRDRPWVGKIRVGNFSPQFSLEATGSSRDLTFMERGAPIDAFAPSRVFGVQIGKPFFDERWTWAVGLFTGAALGDPDTGDASKDVGRFAGRLTWLALDDPEGKEILHLGLSTGLVLTGGDARFQTRPQSHIAPRVVDTDDIDANGAAALALEAAWVRGPWSVQGELLQTFVDAEEEGSLRFAGVYLYGSWFATGETRPYDPRTGVFTQLVPLRPFSLETGGRGALELGARYARTDLNDESISGGVLGQVDLGATWHLNRHYRVKLEVGAGRVHGRRDIGDSQRFRYAQLRLAVSY